MTDSHSALDRLCVNTIRMLAADAVEKARSGHPGLPLGAAAPAYTLWTKFLRHNPANPRWVDRDRFILSAGHGSALLYALLHLTGYNLTIDDLKNFRQWGAKTPGHPEYDPGLGIECTTGPLGQGFSMGAGMALAERHLAARFNKPGFPLVDHYTYILASDGDLMEGVSAEAAGLAGHLGLGKLICLYDDNRISIEGDTALTFTEDTGARFEAYGWHVVKVSDGNDIGSVEQAIAEAKSAIDRPSLVMLRTHLGFGSPKQDKASAHGEPLGAEALAATKDTLGWPREPMFFVPDEALDHFRKAVETGASLERAWKAIAAGYREAYPQEGQEFQRTVLKCDLPAGWDRAIPRFVPGDGAMATRVASGKVLHALSRHVPNLIGGAADLAPSTNTLIAGSPDQERETPTGRNVRFGVREHAMAAMVNGMALHGGTIPYAATFMIFSDYMRPALRLAALMNAHSIFVFTHDSVGLGEDGPTHQPVEHLASLRAIPNFIVFRPADANETAEGWRIAMTRPGPLALALSRQKLPIFDPDSCDVRAGAAKGAYILADSEGDPDLIIIASGSEVQLALEARSRLAANPGLGVRVVSMPSWELFAEQPASYRDAVLPRSVTRRLSIEAGATFGWERWVGDRGIIIGLDRFGASAPGDEVMKKLGFSVEHLVEKALEMLQAREPTTSEEGEHAV